MSKLVESLQSQMKTIFGDSFGATSEPILNLSEAVENALMERKGGKKALSRAKQNVAQAKKNVAVGKKNVAKSKKNVASAKGKKAAPDSSVFPVSKHNKSVARKRDAEQQGRIDTNMKSFFKHADKEGQKSAGKPRPEKIKGADRKVVSKGASGGGGGGQHNPFKHSPNLGTGPGTPPGFHPVHGKRHHDEKKCWNCKCGNVYEKGCECVGTGSTKDCPKGHVKHVQIHKDYRHAYNDMYHAWQRGEGKHSNRKGKWQGPRR